MDAQCPWQHLRQVRFMPSSSCRRTTACNLPYKAWVVHTRHVVALYIIAWLIFGAKLTCSEIEPRASQLVAYWLQGLLCASENTYSGYHQTLSSGPFPGTKWRPMICQHPLTTSCRAQGPPAWAMWATPKAPPWDLLPSAHSLSLPRR